MPTPDNWALSGDEFLLDQRIEALIERKVAERFDRLQASVDQALAAVRGTSSVSLEDRAALVVFSGDMDRLMASFIIATGAAAMGMQVTMYFTFWGLAALKKTTILKGKSIPEKLLTMMLPSGPEGTGTSKLHMLGLGPVMLKTMMSKHNVETLPSLIALAQELGVQLIACQMSMGIMGITKEELIDGLDYGGVATYIGDASNSRVTLFI
jgi:peroxiredoxin family protein